MAVNAYFGPRRTNRPHATPNYGPVELAYIPPIGESQGQDLEEEGFRCIKLARW